MKKFFVAILFSGALSAATFYGPSPYLSASDSPFTSLNSTYSYLENFQDLSLNTPGVSASAGSSNGDPANGFVDSVEGPAPVSWYVPTNAVRFTFSSAVLGQLPTHAGIVWTDVGFVSSGTLGVSPVIFEAFDASGVSLGSIGPFLVGDGVAVASKAEDRFFGVAHAAGISAIEIRMPESIDWEVDHLQYAAASAIPEPATGLLAVFTLAGLMAARRLRRSC